MSRNEINPDAKITVGEWLSVVAVILAPIAAIILAAAMCGGCASENTGSSTVVGEQTILPEITDSSDNVAVRVFEDIKGARVWTAKDSKVTIKYTNAWTNNVFSIYESRGSMGLDVEIEPLATDCTSTQDHTEAESATR